MCNQVYIATVAPSNNDTSLSLDTERKGFLYHNKGDQTVIDLNVS